jgi:hypothetical protein
MSQILLTKIAAVRRKHLSVAALTGAAAAAGACDLLLAASMILDFYLNFSFTTRAALLTLTLATAGFALLYSVFGPLLYGPDDDRIALQVEDAEPAFRTRLIAAIQLARPNAIPYGGSLALANATIAQAEQIAEPIDFARVVRTERLLRIAALAGLILVLALASFIYAGEVARDLLQRSLFLADIPVPRNTRVYPITTDLLIARGDDVEILALADGTLPPDDRRRLVIKTIPDNNSEPARTQTFTMERVDTAADATRLPHITSILTTPGRDAALTDRTLQKLHGGAAVYTATVENVQESFEYRARLNDGESPQKFTVKVLPRPAITKVEARQVYPAYTARPPENRALGDLSLLQGSKLQLAITTNKKLQRTANFAHLIGSDKDVPLALDARNPQRLTGEIDLPKGTTGFSINLTDVYGLKSKDPAIYRVDLIPDKPPTVRVTNPTRKEVLLVRDARQRVSFEAADDFAIAAAAIRYKLNDGPEQAIPLDLKGQRPRSFPAAYDWRLTDVRSATEGSVVEYWVEVEDTRTNEYGGPNKTASEHYMIRLVSEAEKRAEMAARIADIGSGLRNATEDQEQVAERVGTILLEKQPDVAPAPR